MKKKIFAIFIALASVFAFTFISCNDDEEKSTNGQEKALTAQELRESLIQETIIPSDLDTLSVSIDSMHFIFQQNFMDMYLMRDCYLAYYLLDNKNIDIVVIPYKTNLGNIISKKIASMNTYKFTSFHDKDYEKVSRWAKAEADKGRIVVISKERDGSYTALSYSKTEWALLNTF